VRSVLNPVIRDTWTWNIPEFFNIGTACTDRHLGTPVEDSLAMIVEDDTGAVREATYAALARETGRFSQVLRNLGIAPRERVLIRLLNCLEYPISFLGTLKSGAVAVPTSTLLKAEEVGYLAEDSGARALVTHKDMWPVLSEEVAHHPHLETVLLFGKDGGEGALPSSEKVRLLDFEAEMAKVSEWETPARTRANDPAYLVYTSGTTGFPKGVLHAHRALLGRLPSAYYWFNYVEGERILHSGKFNWTYVLGTGMMDPFYQGKTVLVYEGKNDPHTWPELIARHGCTTFIGVPTVYRQIIQRTEFTKRDMPTLRHCMSAGEHLSDEVLRAWKERFGIDVYEGIGMSECSYYISQRADRPIRPGSAGFPQPGHFVKLLDENFDEVPQGEEGMLCIPESDPGLFLGYWRKPEETAALRKNGWFITGDYGRIDVDGYFWFLGRRDDIINSFGYRISPHEIERVLKGHPGISDCVALGEEIGPEKILVAACVIPAGDANLSEEEIIAYARQHLADYKAPKKVHFYTEFPHTKNGKVLRRALLEQIDD
jgi:acetyl-CoA synthetase